MPKKDWTVHIFCFWNTKKCFVLPDWSIRDISVFISVSVYVLWYANMMQRKMLWVTYIYFQKKCWQTTDTLVSMKLFNFIMWNFQFLHCDHALLKILKVLRGEKHTRVWKIHARLPQTQLTMSLAIWFCRHKRGWKFASVVSRLQMLKHKCLGCSHWLCSLFTCNSTTFHLPIWIHLLLWSLVRWEL